MHNQFIVSHSNQQNCSSKKVHAIWEKQRLIGIYYSVHTRYYVLRWLDINSPTNDHSCVYIPPLTHSLVASCLM